MSERKSKKIFGIFNIVDMILILLVILVGIVGAKMFLGGNDVQETSEPAKTYSYVVMGQKVMKETAELPVVGAEVYNSSTSEYLGVVTDVKSEPHTEAVFNEATGQYEKAPIAEYCNLYVTIAGQGTETEKDIIVEGTTVKVGMNLNVKGKGYAYQGYVVEVRGGE